MVYLILGIEQISDESFLARKITKTTSKSKAIAITSEFEDGAYIVMHLPDAAYKGYTCIEINREGYATSFSVSGTAKQGRKALRDRVTNAIQEAVEAHKSYGYREEDLPTTLEELKLYTTDKSIVEAYGNIPSEDGDCYNYFLIKY